MENLSESQRKAIAKMIKGIWHSAYDLQTSLATLRALVRKNILESKRNLGSLFCPRTGIQFRLKKNENGNEYLRESTKDLCRWRKRMKIELSMNIISECHKKKMRFAIREIEEVLLERLETENC